MHNGFENSTLCAPSAEERRLEGNLIRSSSDAASLCNVELPLTVKDAARYLGVSAQTVYLWVERKQIPHLRVMGRNIRFLKSDLESFRASFRQEMVNV